jgi:hypothetical protein
MKANELMIGDWVRYPNGKGRILVLAQDGLYLEDKEGRCYACSYDKIRPIPITPEILEKNGWKHEFDKKPYMVKYDLAVEGKNCWMMWAIKEHNLDIQRQDEKLDMYNLKVQRVCMPCDFVHQLQHALRLCKIEKAIEL